MTERWSKSQQEILPGAFTIGGQTGIHVPSLDAAIIADTHVGIENVFASNGLYAPVSQRKDLETRLAFIQEQTDASTLIIDGDFKHSFAVKSKGELKEVRRMFEFILEHFEEVVLVRGNHDNFVSWATRGLKHIKMHKNEYREGRFRFTHGHQRLDTETSSPDDIVIIGHEHPAVARRGDVGQLLQFPALLSTEIVSADKIKASIGHLIVLPAFTKLAAGVDISTQRQEDMLSPIIRDHAELPGMTPYVVDEIGGAIKLPALGTWIRTEENSKS